MVTSGATPILDRRLPMPTRSFWAGVPIILCAIFAVFVASAFLIAAGLVPASVFNGSGSTGWFGAFLCVMVALRAMAVVHELGHLSAGLLLGSKVLAFNAWPVSIRRAGRGGPLRLVKPSGQPVTVMIHRDSMSAPETLAYLCAGAGANALAAIASIALAKAMPAQSIASASVDAWIVSFLDYFTVISIVAAIVNLLPFRNRRLPSDGAKALDVLSNSPVLERDKAFKELNDRVRSGVRLQDVDPAIVKGATAVRDDSIVAMYANKIAYAYEASRRSTSAGDYLEAALASSALATKAERDSLAAEAAVYFGWYRRDAAMARRWAESVATAKLTALDRRRVDIVLDWIAGDVEAAIAGAEALRALPGTTSPALKAAFEETMTEWIEEMRAGGIVLLEPQAPPAAT